ncbi:MAG: penicillin-binding protein 2 [Gammaproteobacteria bacterium PRO9]|nr:penicillin-binding protein 2 [Gammaproteobacteria bacterium PRO9]
MARTLRIKDHWREQQLFTGRLLVAVVVVLGLTGLVITRLVQLQIVQFDYYSAQSSGNRIRVQPVAPIRGLILDRNGAVLAENTPSYQLEMTPEQVPDMADTLKRLVESGIIDAEDVPDLEEQIASRRSFDTVVIAERLTDEELAVFAVRRPQFPGVDIRARLARSYPYGRAAAHVLGYVGGISVDDKKELDPVAYAGTTHVGKVAAERSFESLLHGTPGHEDVVVNAHGRKMQELDRVASQPGDDVILTIDLKTQLAAHEALKGWRGAAVAIDPRNGEVLALASTPAFDPNALSSGLSRRAYLALQQDIDLPLFNRALRGQYPPGSTIKPIVGLAALHYGVVRPDERVGCHGYFSLPGSSHRYRDWKPGGHGNVDLYNAIEQSCDVYFYSAARGLGIDRMASFMKAFGLGSVSGLDIGGEQQGLVPTPEWKRKAFKRPAEQVWFPGETVIAGIGQGYVLVTPVQLADAAATIASRGERFRPTLLKGLRDPATGHVEYEAPKPLPRVPDTNPAFWDAIIEGMHGVMQGPRGTARAVGQRAPWPVAGKSGTAQVFTVAQNAKYNAAEISERRRDHALFIAFAPLDDPRIAVAVVVENGEGGSKVAAPIALSVMEAYLGGAKAGTEAAAGGAAETKEEEAQ